MAECECLPKCPFFHQKDPSPTDETNKKVFCLGDNSGCARYLIFKHCGPGKAPADLKPIEISKAKQIIASLTKK